MSDEEIIDTLDKFQDYLHVGDIFSDPFRWIGWIIVKGLMYILDGLENITDDVLMLKKFFKNDDIVSFVESFRPVLIMLLAFSLLWAGYMMIFQKKFNREGMAINLFIALTIIALLGTAMEKANDFTDDAIDAIGQQQLYGEEEGTISQNILSKHITDLVEFDKTGWTKTDLDRPNTIPLSMIQRISITEKFDSDRSELDMSSDGKDISKYNLLWVYNQKDLAKFDQSGLEWNNQYYYRYSLNWITLIATLIVMAFTLLSIAYKLARLSFSLAFNYILANLVAPADIHDGQKTKRILQSILNTFLVIILIFLSMKVYIIGTDYISNELSGIAYLVALIAFSVAVVDGPNIVEQLFGIDAGLKSGWGLVGGAYAGAKFVSSVAKGVRGLGSNKKGEGSGKDTKQGVNNSGKATEKAPSPNDPPNVPPTSSNNNNIDSGKCKKCGQKPCVCDIGSGAKGSTGSEKTKAPSPNDSIDGKGNQSTEAKAPSPNDSDDTVDVKGNQSTEAKAPSPNEKNIRANPSIRQKTKAPSPNDESTLSANTSSINTNSVSSGSSSGMTKKPTNNTKNDVQRSQAKQRTRIENSSINETEHVAGSSSSVASGSKPSNKSSKHSSSSNTNKVQRAQSKQKTRIETDVINETEHVAGSSTSVTSGSKPTTSSENVTKNTTHTRTENITDRVQHRRKYKINNDNGVEKIRKYRTKRK